MVARKKKAKKSRSTKKLTVRKKTLKDLTSKRRGPRGGATTLSQACGSTFTCTIWK